VGFDQGGLLTEAVTRNPHSVLLLDEIEKAHPDVYNILLQIMDHGKLTDTNGREADFRNVILVMTTNAGAQQSSRRSIGFTEQDHVPDSAEAIRRTFTPEFRNRLDSVIQFTALDFSVVLLIVDKFILELEAQLSLKDVSISVSAPAREWLAEQGFDPEMGARPMKRVIQNQIKRPLADALLFGELSQGGEVDITLSKKAGTELKIRIKAKQVPPKALPASTKN
jgi:ATP-dependent Clp protease ATP-binding subunit ClpA